jgi:hypothetical protein
LRRKLGGDLKGDRAYANIDGAVIVPDLDPALGLGLVLGLKGNFPSGRALALEGSLQGSRHDGTFGGLTRDVDFGLLSADIKLFPTTGGRVEPWVQAGLCLASLRVNDGFFPVSGGQKDATFTGGGVNLGAGLMSYVSRRVALRLAAIYRFIKYDELDYGPRAELMEDLKGNALSLELGVTFHFSRD